MLTAAILVILCEGIIIFHFPLLLICRRRCSLLPCCLACIVGRAILLRDGAQLLGLWCPAVTFLQLALLLRRGGGGSCRCLRLHRLRLHHRQHVYLLLLLLLLLQGAHPSHHHLLRHAHLWLHYAWHSPPHRQQLLLLLDRQGL